MKISILIFFFLIPTSFVFALETDNYLVWNRELADSSPSINTYMNEQIEEARQSSESCEDFTAKVGKKLRSILVHHNPVENWLMEHLNSSEVYPTSIYHVPQSIYRNPYLPHIPKFGLAANVQVNGYYFGTDKLSHFASTGYDYFKIFMKSLKSGLSDKEALRKAVNFGIHDEKTLHGYWASGVFSYADLEANYQGLKFYRSLCESPVSSFDITTYVNGFWDESFYLSYRVPKNWKKVSKVLRETVCANKSNPIVTQRMRYYKETSQQSPSMDYLQTLGDLPSTLNQKDCL